MTTFSKKNFKNLDPVERSRLASIGGSRAHELGKAHQWDSQAAREAGLKGQESRRRNAAKRAAEQLAQGGKA